MLTNCKPTYSNMSLEGKSVLIAGGTGLIGTHLSNYLTRQGMKVSHLSRSKQKNSPYTTFTWNPVEHRMDTEALQDVNYIINLAGAGVADGRWTQARKKLILESRLDSAATFEKHLAETGIKPNAYLSASAVGYYGDRGEEILTEESEPGTGFLSETTVAWEKAADAMENYCQVVKVRIGLVLSTKGGALPSMANPQKLGVGALMGSGKQFYPWIHIHDMARIFEYLMENRDLDGVVNGTAPVPVRQTDLVDAIKKGMNRPAIKLPAPSFVLKTMLGEMATAVLDSTRAVPEKLNKAGFEFEHADIIDALRHLVENKI